MQKKIIALAIAAAFSAPAFADTSNVTVYGLLNADFESVTSSNVNTAAAPFSNTLNRVVSNASRVGIKGTEDLGDGLKGIYQLEAQFNVDGTGGTGFGGGTRNSNVGLTGGFGTAFLGNWDTPYKVTHNKIELFDNTTFASALNVLGRTSATNGNFNTRLANSVQYWTPVLSGFQGKLAYGTDNLKSVNAAGTGTNTSRVSLSATYENDMFYAAYGFEAVKDLALGTSTAATPVKTAGDKSDGSRLVGAYKFDNGLVGLTYEKLSGSVAATGVSTSRSAWELAGKYTMGANNFGLTYVSAGNLGGVVNTGAKQLSLRYGYTLSKRTEVFGMYSALTNDSGAMYNLSAGNAVTAAGAAPAALNGVGSKLSGFGAGLVHTF